MVTIALTMFWIALALQTRTGSPDTYGSEASLDNSSSELEAADFTRATGLWVRG